MLADPQLVDPHTYPDRPWPLSALTYLHTDQYLRRSFIALQRILDPDSVYFLGDLFDGGREWATTLSKSADKRWRNYSDSVWFREYSRFAEIFLEPWSRARPKKHRRLVASLPGNHDLGFGNGIQLPVRQRFTTFFGSSNRIDIVGNHSFVSVDSVSLSARRQAQEAGAASNEAIWEVTEKFLDLAQEKKAQVLDRELRRRQGLPENPLLNHTAGELKENSGKSLWKWDNPEKPPEMSTVLLTHVPLFRNPGTPCGPLRERWPPKRVASGAEPLQSDDANAISVHGGYQYQNVLDPEISKELIEKVGNVAHVFSGDDHDYCEVIHRGFTGREGGVREITVKSLSWAMGVRKPGFLILSLWNPVDARGEALPKSPLDNADGMTIQTHLCLLPDQLNIFIRYAILFVCTLMILAGRAFEIASHPGAGDAKDGTSLLPVSGQSTSAFDKEDQERSHLGSYSSSNSAEGYCNGLAVRSNTRTRSVSPAKGYGQEQPTPENDFQNRGVSVPHGNSKPALDVQYGHAWGYAKSATGYLFGTSKPSLRLKTAKAVFFQELVQGIVQVGIVALIWYAWLAHTV